jgi:predicted small secreted protein
MKKLVFMFVAFAAISLASCGNKAAGTDENADSAVVVEEAAPAVEEVAAPADSVAAPADSTAQAAQ